MDRMRMRPHHLALGLSLVAATAAAAVVSDFYGKWSRGDCAEEWVMFAEGKVTQFSSRFQAVETAENPSAARKAAPAAAKPPAPAAKSPEPAKTVEQKAAAAPAASAPPKAVDPAEPAQPRNPATARKLVDTQPRNPATARKVTEEPKAATAAPATAAAPPAKASPKSKEMVVPATFKLDGDRLSVETQEQGRKPRREVYAMADKDTLVLQDTFVDGRRIPPITRDQITYKRCK
jgi:hypothetical protein